MTIRCILYFTKYGTLLTIIHNYIELSYFSFRHLQPWFRMILVQTVISMQRPSSLAKKKKMLFHPLESLEHYDSCFVPFEIRTR